MVPALMAMDARKRRSNRAPAWKRFPAGAFRSSSRTGGSAAPGLHSAQKPQPLIPPQPKPQPSPKINPQRRIPDDFFMLLIQSILNIQVRRHMRLDCIPSSQIDARVPRRMINPEPEKIRVWTPPNETSAYIRTPSTPQIIQQQTTRVLRTP